MKNLLVVFSLVVFAACSQVDTKSNGGAAKASTDTANYTTIQWIDSVMDVGKLIMGKTIDIDFRFKNTGDKPLYIISAQPGCGCTLADYPKEAIMPGKEGTIKASFDTNKGAVGAVHKNINVVTNTKYNANHILFFTGEIVKEGSTDSTSTSTVTKHKKRPFPAATVTLKP